MTNESDPSNETPQTVALRINLEKLKLELDSINQGIQTSVMGQILDVTWGPARYLNGGEDDEETEEDNPESGEGNNSVYTDEDDDSQSLLRCTFCDFEIDFSAIRYRLEEMHYCDPKNMLCPVCDEKLGEEAIRVVWNSISQKRTWKSDKSSISSVDSVVLDKKLPTREAKHDPLLSPFISNVSVSNSSGIHTGEGFSCNASDVSDAKGSETDSPPDSGDEKDAEERRLKAYFVQELVLSTLI